MMITIPLKHCDGRIEYVIVDASMPFEMFGFKFAAHRGTQKGDAYWRVVETSTGTIVRRGDTRRQAIKQAKETLALVGEEKLRKSVKKILRQQKKEGKP